MVKASVIKLNLKRTNQPGKNNNTPHAFVNKTVSAVSKKLRCCKTCHMVN